MGKTLDEMMAALPKVRRSRIEARAAELTAQEMTLRELRKAMGRTQAEIARATGKPQATISRMEAQSDMLLSNLSQVVAAMGGRLHITAELPGRAPVVLTGLGDLSPVVRRTVRTAGGASPAKADSRRRRAATHAEG